MNTETAVNGIEVYTGRLFELADEYTEEWLHGDKGEVSSNFRDLIFYLADRMQKIPNGDIEALDAVFSAYVRLCARYGRLPTVELFAMLVKINPTTLTDWKNGEYRSTTHSKTVKKWLDICRGFVVDELSNSRTPNPNLIFTAKAAYGLRETSPVPAPEIHQGITAQTPEEIAAKYGKILTNGEPLQLPDVPEVPD